MLQNIFRCYKTEVIPAVIRSDIASKFERILLLLMTEVGSCIMLDVYIAKL